MPALHLVSHHLCPYVQRAVIVLSEKGIAHDRTYIDLADRPDWFVKMSPLGRVPVLQVDDTVLFESQVIAEYLDEASPGSLFPADLLEKARHRSWIEYGSETLNAIGALYNARNKAVFDDKRVALRHRFERMEREIVGPFFSGDRFHMIDGVWGTIFRYFDVFDQIGDFGTMTGLDKVRSWRVSVSSRRSVETAAPDGYPERLLRFFRNRNSYVSKLIDGAGR